MRGGGSPRPLVFTLPRDGERERRQDVMIVILLCRVSASLFSHDLTLITPGMCTCLPSPGPG